MKEREKLPTIVTLTLHFFPGIPHFHFMIGSTKYLIGSQVRRKKATKEGALVYLVLSVRASLTR